VRLLFDTHVLVWWFVGDLRIPERLRGLVSISDTLVHVSAATAWELATKHRIGKLPEAGPLVDEFFDFIDRCNFMRLPVTVEHGHRAGLLPGDHKDPFDRRLAAQALIEDLDLVTADPALAALGARVMW